MCATPLGVPLRDRVQSPISINDFSLMSDCDNKQVDDWNEATFLGAAVGILVTVSLAAAAAVVLVLVRNRVGICCVIPDVCTVPVMAVCPNRCYMFEHGLKSITTVIEFFWLNKLKTLF